MPNPMACDLSARLAMASSCAGVKASRYPALSQREQRLDEPQRVGRLDRDRDQVEEGHQHGEVPADRPQQDVEDERHDDGAEDHDQLAGDAQAPQELHRPEVGGRGRRVPRHDDPALDERLVEDAHDDGDQVQQATEPGQDSRRRFDPLSVPSCLLVGKRVAGTDGRREDRAATERRQGACDDRRGPTREARSGPTSRGSGRGNERKMADMLGSAAPGMRTGLHVGRPRGGVWGARSPSRSGSPCCCVPSGRRVRRRSCCARCCSGWSGSWCSGSSSGGRSGCRGGWRAGCCRSSASASPCRVTTVTVYLLSTRAGAPPFWLDKDRMDGFMMLTFLSILLAPWTALGALLRQKEAFARHQALAFELERSELERQALDARLHLLQAQVAPHFLFNTLANVQALVDAGSPRASTVLRSLIAYLRAAVPLLHEPATTLEREVRAGPGVSRADAHAHARSPAVRAARRRVGAPAAVPADDAADAGGERRATRHRSERGGRPHRHRGATAGRPLRHPRQRQRRGPAADGRAGWERASSTLRERLQLMFGDDARLHVSGAGAPRRLRRAGDPRAGRGAVDASSVRPRLIADDEPLLREALARQLAQAWPELEIVAAGAQRPRGDRPLRGAAARHLLPRRPHARAVRRGRREPHRPSRASGVRHGVRPLRRAGVRAGRARLPAEAGRAGAAHGHRGAAQGAAARRAAGGEHRGAAAAAHGAAGRAAARRGSRAAALDPRAGRADAAPDRGRRDRLRALGRQVHGRRLARRGRRARRGGRPHRRSRSWSRSSIRASSRRSIDRSS